ncbi:hypothetical protein ACLK2H_05965 [Escherichia coli]
MVSWYANRNMVGAVVGVQPFGGEGSSARPESRRPDVPYGLLASRPGNRTGYHLVRQDTAGQVVDTERNAANKPLTELQGWLANRP